MKNIISAICVIGGLLTQGCAYAASSQKCVELHEALKEYEEAREALANARSDAWSFSRDSKALPIVKELAGRRANHKEERAVQALLNLRSVLTSVEVAKNWEIPNYEGVQNINNIVFYTLAADVACMGG